MKAADSAEHPCQGNGDGEDDKAATVDEGRCADAQEARAREDKGNCDRAQAETDAGSDVQQGE